MKTNQKEIDGIAEVVNQPEVNDNLLNFDFEHSSDDQLRQWLKQTYPIVAKFLAAAQKICTRPKMDCDTCSLKKECDQKNLGKKDRTCLILEPHLPGRDAGRGYLEKRAGNAIDFYSDESEEDLSNEDMKKNLKHWRDNFVAVRKIRSDEEFLQYESVENKLTLEQFEVVCLRVRDGHKYKDIAKELNISVSAASDRYRRAKAIKEKYFHNRNIRKST